MDRFAGKCVIITGSSTGIGRATAVLFAKEGASVTITSRKADALEQTKAEILKNGVGESKVHIVVGDITNKSVQQKLINSTVAKFGKLDVLVNNAGASIPDSQNKKGFEASEETYQKNMDLNVTSVLQLINLARPHLIATKGEIVNISSIGALKFANTSKPYYSIAKAALDQLTRALSIDLIAHGVRVNSVNPGVVATQFANNAGLSAAGVDQFHETLLRSAAALPIRTIGQPEHIAPIIAFLAHRPSSFYIVGQTIIADGGTTLMMASMAALAERPSQ